MLPRQFCCSVVHGLTLRLHCIGCILWVPRLDESLEQGLSVWSIHCSIALFHCFMTINSVLSSLQVLHCFYTVHWATRRKRIQCVKAWATYFFHGMPKIYFRSPADVIDTWKQNGCCYLIAPLVSSFLITSWILNKESVHVFSDCVMAMH